MFSIKSKGNNWPRGHGCIWVLTQINKHAPSALLLLPSSVLLCVLQYFRLNIFEPISWSGSWRKVRWSHDRRRSKKTTSNFESSQKAIGHMLQSLYLFWKVHRKTLWNASTFVLEKQSDYFITTLIQAIWRRSVILFALAFYSSISFTVKFRIFLRVFLKTSGLSTSITWLLCFRS